YFFGKCGVNHIFYVICLLNLLNFSCLVEIVTNMWHFCFIGDLILNNDMNSEKKRFIDAVSASYDPKGAYIQLGSGLLGDEIITDAKVNLALKIMNRHGLIAGATGTGKTRTLQLMAEQLSDKGVPVLMLVVKGDLSGLAEKGNVNEALIERGERVGIPFEPAQFPIEICSLSGDLGVPMRITVQDFGPVLLARVLDLN